MFGPGSQGGGTSGDIVTIVKNWWETCPQFTKHLVYLCGGTYAVSWVLPFLVYYLLLIPDNTINSLMIWQLFTTPIVLPSLLTLLFGFLAFLPMCGKHEREWGTVKCCADFFLKNLEINLVYCFVTYILSLILTQYLLLLPIFGLWPIFFLYLVDRCLEDPDGISMLLCLPVQIKNKYYPIALVLLFGLISGRFPYSDFIALGVGWLNYNYVNARFNEYMNPTRMAAWENLAIFEWMKSQPNYINSSGVISNATSSTAGGSSSASSGGNVNQPRPAATSAFSGRGVTLGGTAGAGDLERDPVPTGTKKNENYYQLDEDHTPDLDIGTSPAIATDENKINNV